MKKAARGCPRIQIWSHEGPNQSQNHVSGRSWFHPVGHPGRPVNHGFSHPASRKARVASGLEPRHVLRKQAIFFFFGKNTHPGKTACHLMNFGHFFFRFLVKICQNLKQNVPGPHFSLKFRPGPKYGVSSRRNAKFCVSSRRDDRFWQMCAKFARGLPHGKSL